MKTTYFFMSILLLLCITTVSAQMGYGRNQGAYGYGRTGMNNGMNSGMGRPSTPKEKPVEESIDKIIEPLKKDLKLDELQVIAISNILTESVKSQNTIMKKEGSQDDKLKAMQGLSDATDIKIMNLLYKEQKEKYKLFIQERKLRMESLSERQH